MSAARISCPSCGASLRASGQGKKIRCPGCEHIFRFEDADDELPPAKRKNAAIQSEKPGRKPLRDPDEDDEDDAPDPAATRTYLKGDDRATHPKRKARPDEDEDEDQPRKKSRKGSKAAGGSNKGLIIGASLGGGLAVLGLVLFLVLRKGDDSPPRGNPGPDGGTQPPAVKPPDDNPQAGLAPEVLARVRKATVYIRVKTEAGEEARGTGFFGVNGDLVLTNAHVLGMLEKNTPAPKSIDVILNSGEKNESRVQAAVVTVDRGSDLAVLRVRGAPPGGAWPDSLTVKQAAGLQLTQPLFVIGYPFGESLGKNVTVSSTSVSSLRTDRQGNLDRVQVNGGMHQGNSGGPVVDARGNVVAVAVSILRNTSIHFAIPGEKVHAVLQGRLSESSVGDPYVRDGKLVVRMTLQAADPLGGIKDLAVDWWYGDPGEARPAGTAQAAVIPGDGARTTTPVPYQARLGVGVVEIPLTKMPETGKVLWAQPSLVDGAGARRWVAATPHRLAPPVEPVAAELTREVKLGRAPLDINSNAKYVLKTSAGDNHSLVHNISARFWEDVRRTDKDGTSVTYYSVADRYQIGMMLDEEAVPPSPRLKQVLQDVNKVGLIVESDPRGAQRRKWTDDRRLPQPSKSLLNAMAEQLHASLDAMVVALPGKVVEPGHAWKGLKAMPIDPNEDDEEEIMAEIPMTYTYRGMRKVDGKQLAVIDLVGNVRGYEGHIADVRGEMSGEAIYNVVTKRFTQVKVHFALTVRLRFRDESVMAQGVLDVELKRGEVAALPGGLPTMDMYATTPEQTGGLFELQRFSGSEDVPAAVVFSADGRTLAAAARNTLVFWDTSTGRVVNRLTARERCSVQALMFSRDGKQILVGGTNSEGTSARLLTVSGGKVNATLAGHGGQIRAVWLSADSLSAATASDDGTVRTWDARTGEARRTIAGDVGPISLMAVSPNGQYALVQGRACAVLDLRLGRRLKVLTDLAANHLAALPDNRNVLCGCLDGTVRTVDLLGGKVVKTWTHHPGKVDHVTVRGDGRRALSTGSGGTLAIWDVLAGKTVHTTKAPDSYGTTLLSPDGRFLACVAPLSTDIRLLELPAK